MTVSEACPSLAADQAQGGRTAAEADTGPVVAVHGIWDNARRLAPLIRGLQSRGILGVEPCELRPASGRAPLSVLAEQLAAHVEHRRAQIPSGTRLRLVGFSMGALVCRLYLQKMQGERSVSTFVSIAGPHRGTVTAYGLPWAGVREMRPGSSLLRDLGADVGGLATRVHCIYTPYDAMIIPQRSAVLDGASSVHQIPVLWHRAMLRDRRVLRLTAQLLSPSLES